MLRHWSVLLIALAAGGLLDPLAGALAQSLAVLAVVADSARILRFGPAAGVISAARSSLGRSGLPRPTGYAPGLGAQGPVAADSKRR
ncbi:MAG: hypothetical protein ACHQ9S_09755 [Candidatus Binatia bacterium]